MMCFPFRYGVEASISGDLGVVGEVGITSVPGDELQEVSERWPEAICFTVHSVTISCHAHAITSSILFCSIGQQSVSFFLAAVTGMHFHNSYLTPLCS